MQNVHSSFAALALFLCFVTSCGNETPQRSAQAAVADVPMVSGDPDPFLVSKVDLNRYVGEWFEIASLPRPFQSFCSNTTASYKIIGENEISIVNKCKVGFAPIAIEGTARVIDSKTHAVLEVSFKNLRSKGDYRIIGLDKDYQYALVTDKDRSSLFILSRTQTLYEPIYQTLLDRAKSAGVDTSKVRRTSQD